MSAARPSELAQRQQSEQWAQWVQWQTRRQEELTAPEGWLSLIGLHWLGPLETPTRLRLGSAGDNDVVLAAGPAYWGELSLGETCTWRSHEGEGTRPAKPLASDLHGAPDVIRALSQPALSFVLLVRDGQWALRLRQQDAPARANFGGISLWPFDPGWQVEARWEATPQTLVVANASGGLETRQLSGRAHFSHEGQAVTLTPLDENESGLFFVFADATSGKKQVDEGPGSYGAGRFLWAALPKNGVLTLDFNRAYNPPCAFTPFATCPLAPPENRLPFAVKAGEKAPSKGA